VNEGGCRVSKERCREAKVETEAETVSEESESVTETWRVGNAERWTQERDATQAQECRKRETGVSQCCKDNAEAASGEDSREKEVTVETE
jgi:hypothetical protein